MGLPVEEEEEGLILFLPLRRLRSFSFSLRCFILVFRLVRVLRRLFPDRTNLPKEVMMFPDFPFDPQLSSFLPHQEVQRYLERYCENFQIRPHIRVSLLRCSVPFRRWTLTAHRVSFHSCSSVQHCGEKGDARRHGNRGRGEESHVGSDLIGLVRQSENRELRLGVGLLRVRICPVEINLVYFSLRM